MASPLRSLRVPPDVDALIEAHRLKHGLAWGAALLDLARLGYASTQPKPKAQPKPPTSPAPAKRTIPDDVPSWMRRGFETGRWR